MKKLALILGLSTAFVTHLAYAENFIDQSSLAFEENKNIYIKPFGGYGMHLTKSFYNHDFKFKVPINPELKSQQSLKTTDLDAVTLHEQVLNWMKGQNNFPRTIVDHIRPTSSVDPVLPIANLKLKLDHVLFGGVDIGIDINDYFGIAGEIGYHYFQSSGDLSFSSGQYQAYGAHITLPSLSVINCMLKPVISASISEGFSFYVTGGIGGHIAC